MDGHFLHNNWEVLQHQMWVQWWLQTTASDEWSSSSSKPESAIDIDDLLVTRWQKGVFHWDFQEIVETDANFATCETDMSKWDKLANKFIKEISEEIEVERSRHQEDILKVETTTSVLASHFW